MACFELNIMGHHSTIIFVVFCCLIRLSYCSGTGTVTILNHTNFNNAIANGNSWLIEFYAPWCSHCRKLAIVLDGLAKSLESHNELHIAKFDCTATNSSLIANEYNIKAFPTLLYFKNGLYYGKYEDSRTKDALEKFLLNLLQQQEYFVVSKDEALLDQRLSRFQYAFVLTIPSALAGKLDINEVTAKAVSSVNDGSPTGMYDWILLFRRMSSKWYLKTHFIIYVTENVNNIQFSRMELKKPSLDFIRYDADIKKESSGLTLPSVEELNNFVETNNHPFFTEIDSHNSRILGHLNKTMALLIIDPKTQSSYVNKFETACLNWYNNYSRNIKNNIIFGHIDGVKFKKYFIAHGVNARIKDMPVILLLNSTHDLYHAMPLHSLLNQQIDSMMNTENLNKAIGNLFDSYIHTIEGVDIDSTRVLTMKPFQRLAYWEKIQKKVVENHPWGIILCVLPFVLIIIAALMPQSSDHKLKKH